MEILPMKKPFTLEEKVWYIHQKLVFLPSEEVGNFLDKLESGEIARRLDENTLSRIADFTYSIRFLRLLTTPWTDTQAFKKGIIDDKGIPLKKLRDMTADEKSSYNMFHRIVFFIKRLLNKIPFIGKNILTSYAAAFLMIKEECGLSEEEILGTMQLVSGEVFPSTRNVMSEENSHIFLDKRLKFGEYILKCDTLSYSSLKERTIPSGKILTQHEKREGISPHSSFKGVDFYLLTVESSGEKVLVSKDSILLRKR